MYDKQPMFSDILPLRQCRKISQSLNMTCYNSIFLIFWQSTTIAKQSRESNLIPRALSNLSLGGRVGQEPGKEVAKKEQLSICDNVVFMLIIIVCLLRKSVKTIQLMF